MASRVTHRISHHAARVFQFAAFPLVWTVSKLAVPTTVRGHERLAELEGPAILIANHIAFYDSFLLRLATRWKTLPFRFMGVTSFRRPHLRVLKSLGIIHAAYLLFGVFTVVPGRGMEKNTQTAKEILARGGTVLVYPEGYINTSGKLLPFKHGASVIALASKATVVPIYFMQKNGSTRITIGDPFKPRTRSVEETTAYFQKTLSELAERELADVSGR